MVDTLKYNSVKKAIKKVGSGEYTIAPSAFAFANYYVSFAKEMGISAETLNAHSLVSAMFDAYILTINQTAEQFCEKVNSVFLHFRRQAFESYVTKCATEGTTPNFNKVSKEVDLVMGALLQAVDPIGFKDKNSRTAEAAAIILGGKLAPDEADSNANDRAQVIEYVRAKFAEGEASAVFEEAVSKRFDDYTTENRSSAEIAKNAKDMIRGFNDCKRSTENGLPGFDKTSPHSYKIAMLDEACALERRIETRYASVFAKIFRCVSYFRQQSALSAMKKALGIPSKTRVADCHTEMRLNEIFTDVTDPQDYENEAKTNDATNSIDRIINNLSKNVEKINDVSKETLVDSYRKHIAAKKERAAGVTDPLELESITAEDIERELDINLGLVQPPKEEVKEEPAPENNEGEKAKEEVKENEEKAEDNEEIQEENNEVKETIYIGFGKRIPLEQEPEENVNAEAQSQDDVVEEPEDEEIETAAEIAMRADKIRGIREKLLDKQIAQMEYDLNFHKENLKTEINIRNKSAKESQDLIASEEKAINVYNGQKEQAKTALEDAKENYENGIVAYQAYTATLMNTEKIDSLLKEKDNSTTVDNIGVGVVADEGDIALSAFQARIDAANEEIKNQTLRLESLDEKIAASQKSIELAKDNIENKKNPSKSELELEKMIKELEIKLSERKTNREDILESGEGLEDFDPDEYDENYNKINGEEEEGPIWDQVGYKENITVNLNSEETSQLSPRVEQDTLLTKELKK